jgi:hypothetical protein
MLTRLLVLELSRDDRMRVFFQQLSNAGVPKATSQLALNLKRS